MQLNKADIQYLVNAIDTHIRSKGIAAAGQSVLVATKLQEQLKTAPDAPAPQGNVVETTPPADSDANPE